ncbi:hypothetical protein ACIQVU_08030 [Lysinibacillus sp. NPDC098008]|uniref:hypothetical protein n=1 Tax=Lysinibacillus sp. NPDC098008 TaxID=3364146 RepID=UPI0037F831EB
MLTRKYTGQKYGTNENGIEVELPMEQKTVEVESAKERVEFALRYSRNVIPAGVYNVFLTSLTTIMESIEELNQIAEEEGLPNGFLDTITDLRISFENVVCTLQKIEHKEKDYKLAHKQTIKELSQIFFSAYSHAVSIW